MNQFIFKNRWFAAGFVAFMLLATYVLVGDEDGGLLSRFSSRPAAPLPQASAPVAPPPPLPTEAPPPADAAQPVTHEYMEDEELVDPATGTDPTPREDAGTSDGMEEGGNASTGDSGSRFEMVNGVAVLKKN
ncbi:hypothetical protein H0274_10175 [Altererythrobacter sp. CC-YST694]|uniref:hypothetical protein n=1 Tax=Altererythrobacter sp. CC-YST694 TaxID=2755038 RepID=UPI001D031F33|nr:hypothetical protein [Altererythrobacter sp. CC-YST694]MCB5425624.1 hypothetical protein [Altererythrobacter sp. CC-YST694]